MIGKKKSLVITGSVLIFASGLASAALAQDDIKCVYSAKDWENLGGRTSSIPEVKTESEEVAIARQGIATLTTESSNPVGGAGQRIEIQTAQTSSMVSLSLTQTATKLFGAGSSTAFKGVLAAPVTQGNRFNEFARLDQLTDGVSLSFSITNYHRRLNLVDDSAFLDAVRAEIYAGCTVRGHCDPVSADRVKLSTYCQRTYAPQFNQSFGDYFELPAPHYVWGVSGSIGNDEFSFLNDDTLAREDSRETPWSVAGYVGIVPKSRKALYLAGFRRQTRFRDAGSRQLCSSPDALGLQDCVTSPVGAPVKDVANVIYIEGRRSFKVKPLSGNQGVTVRLSYDLRDDELEVDVPIYLFSDAKNNLNGGIRINWQEGRDNELTFGVFVGAGFNLLP